MDSGIVLFVFTHAHKHQINRCVMRTSSGRSGSRVSQLSSAPSSARWGRGGERNGREKSRAGDLELTCSQINLEGSILEIVIAGSKNNMQ